MKKKLPIGIQTIEEIVNENYLYVDKTEYFYKLITDGKYYFISRPRRFGKSLTLSTLKAIFKGKKELFKDQWIYNKIEFEKHPVIHIDFNKINHGKNMETFENSLKEMLLIHAKEYKVSIKDSTPKDMFVELVTNLSEINKVVLLVDEYDKPIIDYITNEEKANENKDFISSFYEAIKGLDEYLKFVILTGVTKIAKVSIFSKLNNLRDISMSREYAGMFGMTEEELYSYFDEYIVDTAIYLKTSEEELKINLKKWYNGYSWDAKTKVYNPFSILSFFKEMKFSNYWFETGTPSFLINQMKNSNYDLTNIKEVELEDYVFSSYDIKKVKVSCLMFQTGYLTIAEENQFMQDITLYKLKVPNYEVEKSLMNHILDVYADGTVEETKPKYIEMLRALKEKEIQKFTKILQVSFASIPYTLYPKKEDYYHSIFFLMMSLIGADIEVEVLTDKGRIDGVLEFNDKIYIIEFKVGKAIEGIKQIKERKYFEKYLNHKKEIILLAVGGFDEKEIEYEVELL